jgi:hypothetical protein
VWEDSYTLTVSPAIPSGTQLSNIASISGPDVITATLDEKVNVVTTGIVDHLPSTGAANDMLLFFGAIPLSLGFSAVQRRLRRRTR